jgi:Glutaminase
LVNSYNPNSPETDPREGMMKAITLTILLGAFGCSATAHSLKESADTGTKHRSIFALEGSLLGYPEISRIGLNTQELEILKQAARTLNPATKYLFGGCESRAHALWQILPTSLRTKVSKIWLFPFFKWTFLPLMGSFHPADNKLDIIWDYHVAVQFFLPQVAEPLILDLALDLEPMTQEQWQRKLELPPSTLAISMPAQYYSFNNALPGCTEKGKNPNANCFNLDRTLFNGGFFEYKSRVATDDIRSNLARDAAGELLLNESTCPSLKGLVASPIRLGEALHALSLPSAVSPTGCEAIAEAYRVEKDRLEKLLPVDL